MCLCWINPSKRERLVNTMAQQKVVLITGGNSGIGEVTARELARLGHKVYVACRDSQKTKDAVKRIKAGASSDDVFHIPLDLGDFESVRACAKAFLAKENTLDILVNNAGLASNKGLTKSGFEMTFGVCHMGHFLLTKLLMSALEKSDEARIINVASMMHWLASGIDMDAQTQPTKGVAGLKEYGVAKLANILFTRKLASMLQGSGITSYSLHPGAVATDVYRGMPALLQPLVKLFMLTPEQGAQTTLFLASAPVDSLKNGAYYINSKPKRTSSTARDEALADALWKQSERWLA